MQGTTGKFSSSGKCNVIGTVTMTVSFVQTYTPGTTSSTITVTAKLVRSDDVDGAFSGSWYPGSDGGISVNGKKVINWYKNAGAIGLTYPGTVGYNKSGSITISHTDATNITIALDKVSWNNYGTSTKTFTIPAVTKSFTIGAIPQPYTLTITTDGNAWVSVNRTSSPSGMGTGAISSGGTIYLNDILNITAGANTEYVLKTLTCNGADISSGANKTVSGNVTIEATAESIANGTVYIYDGSSWRKYQLYVYNGSNWEKTVPYIHNGTDWKKIS